MASVISWVRIRFLASVQESSAAAKRREFAFSTSCFCNSVRFDSHAEFDTLLLDLEVSSVRLTKECTIRSRSSGGPKAAASALSNRVA